MGKKKMILETKATKILFTLRNSNEKNLYQSRIVKLANCSIAHTSSILKQFTKLGVIKKKKGGQRIYISLTDKGKELADCFIRIGELLK